MVVELDNGSGTTKDYTFTFKVIPECDIGRAWKPIFWPDKVRQGEVVKFTVPDLLETDEFGDWSTVCSEATINLVGEPSYVTYDDSTREVTISPTITDDLTNPLTDISRLYGTTVGANYATFKIVQKGNEHPSTETDINFDVFCPFLSPNEIDQKFTTIVEGEELEQEIYTDTPKLYSTQQYYPNVPIW